MMVVQKLVGKAVRRIVKDFKQKELIPLKILFFVQAATIAVLYPYLTLHMKQLGISVEETAIMSAVIPVIGIIMPPLAGMVADKIGNFKILLSLFSLMGGLVSLLLLLVPPARSRIAYPQTVTFDFGCSFRDAGSDVGHLTPRLGERVPCRAATNATRDDLELRLETCGVACQRSNRTSGTELVVDDDDDDATSDPILRGRSYLVKIETDNETRSIIYDGPRSTVRRLPGDAYFFPADGLLSLRCERRPSEEEEEEEDEEEEELPSRDFLPSRRASRMRRDADGRVVCHIGAGVDAFGGIRDARTTKDGDSERSDWFRNRSLVLRHPGPVADLLNADCFDPYRKRRHSYGVSIDGATTTTELSQCEPRCLLSTARKEVCANMHEDREYDANLTFWAYLVIRVLIGIIGSTSYAMYEVAVIAILREQKADYGLQRIYSSIGGIIASPLSGFLIDYASRGMAEHNVDYSPAFYLYAGLKVVCSFLLLFINLEFKQAATSVIADFIEVVKNFEVLALLASCFVLGSAWGYIESFLFWFLQDLGGNMSLMGITIMVGGIAGIPLLILSGPIIDKIGHANVLFIGFVFFSIRLLGYSLIYNPYHCLYFEAMESITASLAMTAAITYAAKLSTTTTDGSIQGLVGGLYYGVGKGAGSLIGGYLMKAYGTRATFRIFAIFTITIGIVYFLVNHCYIRKLPNREGNEICKKEPKKAKGVADDVKVITEKESSKKAAEECRKTPEQHSNDGYVKTEDGEEGKEEEEKKEEKVTTPLPEEEEDKSRTKED